MGEVGCVRAGHALARFTRARGASLSGAAIADVALADVLATVDRYALSSLEGCGAPAGIGGEAAADLLRLYGTLEYAEVHGAARAALTRHLADGGPRVRITDRCQALRESAST